MKVKEVMHRGSAYVASDTPVRDIARLMRADDIGAVPVKADGALVGMVTDRDIACRAVGDGRDLEKLTARDIMSEGAFCCAKDDDLETAVALMEERKVRRLPVMREDDLVGMVGLGDISRRASQRVAAEVLRAVAAHHR